MELPRKYGTIGLQQNQVPISIIDSDLYKPVTIVKKEFQKYV
jgi:hypothetical protein